MKTIVISILLSDLAQGAEVRLKWDPNPVETRFTPRGLFGGKFQGGEYSISA